MARTVNKRQKPQYVAGSAAKGWYEYSVQGIETSANKITKQYMELIGRGASRAAAIQAAWDEAQAWEEERADQIIADLERA